MTDAQWYYPKRTVMRERVSTLTRKGQVTIPVEVRRHLGLNPADKVAFVIAGDGKVELRPARHTLESVFGSVPALVGRETVDAEDQIQDAMDGEAERIVGQMGGR